LAAKAATALDEAALVVPGMAATAAISRCGEGVEIGCAGFGTGSAGLASFIAGGLFWIGEWPTCDMTTIKAANPAAINTTGRTTRILRPGAAVFIHETTGASRNLRRFLMD